MKKATVGAVTCGNSFDHILPAKASYNWLIDLQRLQPLEAALALLPVGWGNECKGQMLGLLAKGWL